MDSIYLRLNKIEKRLEGEEFFEGGLSYCLDAEEVQMSMENIKPLKDALVSVKAISASDELILKQIENSRDDINSLCSEWHIEDDIRNDILDIIEDADLYRVGDEEYYITSGSTYSVFRLLVKDDEYVLIEFYRTD
jgi:beta-xylosidase